jgi:hypothetical protein
MESMRWACAALVLCAGAASCRFTVQSPDFDAGVGGDMAAVDLGPDLGGCLCPNGCGATPTLHCLTLQPSGPVTANDYAQSGLGSMSAAGDVVFDTDNGGITGSITRASGSGIKNGIGFRVATQASGPGVGVFSFAGFTLGAGAHMTFKGSNAFAMASSAAVELDGLVDGSCANNMVGPGGSKGGTMGNDGTGTGAGKGGQSGAGSSGGGGAGHGDSGGSGGLIAAQTSNAGAIWGDLVSPTFVLVGGSGGGAGGNMGGDGGGGGGALQFAVNGPLRVAGTIHVGGCGGRHGGKNDGGGGGGSGGAIVLEAATITLTPTAVLASNGGGGAGGDDMSSNGADATASTVPAPGGSTTSATGGNGGNGGASAALTGQRYTHGRDGINPGGTTFGGGGGGGCGRIALRTQSGVVSDNSMAVTPDPADINTPPNQHMTFYGMASFQ